MRPASSLGTCAEAGPEQVRSEEHTSELQSPSNLVCRLLLEQKDAELAMRLSHAVLLASATRVEFDAELTSVKTTASRSMMALAKLPALPAMTVGSTVCSSNC